MDTYTSPQTRIGLAADHAGYPLKQTLKEYLQHAGFTVVDFGANSTDSVDYPDYAHPLAQAIQAHAVDCGVAVCGSGNGISMALNHQHGIRAALCWIPELARLARAHNDANVLTLPGRFIASSTAIECLQAFMDTPFEGGRHQRRIDKIEG